jgi:DNA-binding SARP family transcriptional activator
MAREAHGGAEGDGFGGGDVGVRENGDVKLSLLDCFRAVSSARQLDLCLASQRLLALLALRPSVLGRDQVAGLLWPVVAKNYARGCLRTTLCRLKQSVPLAVRTSGHYLSLTDSVAVDYRDGQALATRLVQRPVHRDLDVAVAGLPMLSAGLLPAWRDDWVTVEQQSWRQLRLHALESLADALRECRRFAEACLVADAAIRAAPLRESARATMIRVHVAEGNQSEALGELERYRCLVLRELGREPTSDLPKLLSHA